MATQTMTAAGQPAAVRQVNRNWLAIGALLIVALIVGGVAGWVVAGGTTGMGDTSLTDASIAAWTDNDQAALDSQYASTAVFQDVNGGTNHAGIDKIKAYVAYLGTLGFVVERTGPTARSGDYVFTPVRYGRPGDWSYAITLMQLKGGKIVYHTGWMVDAPGS